MTLFNKDLVVIAHLCFLRFAGGMLLPGHVLIEYFEVKHDKFIQMN